MQQMQLPTDAVVRSRRGANLRADRAERGTWAKVRPGYYLRASAIPEGLETWQVARLVTVARARATWMAGGGSVHLTNESAMLALGLETWLAAPDIDFKRTLRARAPRELPAVEVHGVVVPAVQERQVPGRPSPVPQQSQEPRVRYELPSPSEMAVDMARTAHPMVAVGAGSGLLDRLIAERTTSSSRGEANGRWNEEAPDDWFQPLAWPDEETGDRAGVGTGCGSRAPQRGSKPALSGPSRSRGPRSTLKDRLCGRRVPAVAARVPVA